MENDHTTEETEMSAQTAIQTVDEQPVTAPDATSIIQMIERAAVNPNVDINKMERLYEMHEKALDRAAKLSFVRAFSAMQPTLPVIDERGQITNAAGKVQSTYAEWEDINDAIRPILNAHGFTLSFKPGSGAEGKVTVTGILRHIDGHEDEATVPLPLDASGGKNSVQGVGSSLSYGKRYSAIALLNITSRAPRDRDDDGRGAGLGQAAQMAVSTINLCDTLEDLRAWKDAQFDGVSKVVNQSDLKEIVSLYNRRSKAFRSTGPKEAI